jgi:hypothetical protein
MRPLIEDHYADFNLIMCPLSENFVILWTLGCPDLHANVPIVRLACGWGVGHLV